MRRPGRGQRRQTPKFFEWTALPMAATYTTKTAPQAWHMTMSQRMAPSSRWTLRAAPPDPEQSNGLFEGQTQNFKKSMGSTRVGRCSLSSHHWRVGVGLLTCVPRPVVPQLSSISPQPPPRLVDAHPSADGAHSQTPASLQLPTVMARLQRTIARQATVTNLCSKMLLIKFRSVLSLQFQLSRARFVYTPPKNVKDLVFRGTLYL